MQESGLFDVQRENLWPRLNANFKRVAKTRGDDERNVFALAFQQCVRRDRRTQLDRGHIGKRRAVCLEDAPHRLERSVFVMLGAFREQLFNNRAPVGRKRQHVGEGASPIDPELPRRHAAHPLVQLLGVCLAPSGVGRKQIASGRGRVRVSVGRSKRENDERIAEIWMSRARPPRLVQRFLKCPSACEPPMVLRKAKLFGSGDHGRLLRCGAVRARI